MSALSLKKLREKSKDIVMELLRGNEDLFKRDLHARLDKIRFWRKLRKRFSLSEPEDEDDDNEVFDWWKHDMKGVYYSMCTKHKTFYRKGD